MPQIRFAKGNRPPIQFEGKVNLMKTLLDNGVPVASSCHGDGVCAKCRVRIASGMQNLNASNETEVFLKDTNNIAPDHRISCMTEVTGDIEIDTGYW